MASINPGQRKYEEAKSILNLLLKSGHKAMLAGGCVRDRLLGIDPKDYDIATDALPSLVIQILQAKRWRVIPTGIDHGTVTVVGKFSSTEVTTLRADVETDGRKAIVAFGRSFEDDGARRDFTINSMFEDSEGKIYDYYGGKEDILNRRLRFVGDASQRIKEDYLRTLRLIRFHSRLGFAIDHGTIEAVAIHAKGLQIISQERITGELWGILEGRWVSSALMYLKSTQTFGEVFRGFVPPSDQICQQIATIESPSLDGKLLAEMRMAYLLSSLRKDGLHPSEKDVDHFLKDLKSSRQEIYRVEGFFELLHWQGNPKVDVKMDFLDHLEAKGVPLNQFSDIVVAFSKIIDPEAIHKLLECEVFDSHRRKSKIPITGHRLMQLFELPAGPELGHLLAELKRSYRRQEWSTDSEGLELAAQILKNKNERL